MKPLKKLILFIRIITLTLLLTTLWPQVGIANSQNTASVSAVQSQLTNQRVIRVYFDEAPGMGHQSNNLLVMRQLRKLGFGGKFEIIYQATRSDQLTKIQTLFPEFNPSIDHYRVKEIQDLNISLQSFDHFTKQVNAGKVTRQTLAITGGTDDTRFIDLEAKLFVVMNPPGWGGPELGGDGVYTKEGLKIDLAGINHLGPHLEISEVTSWPFFIKERLSKTQFERIGDNLISLFQRLEHTPSMPWYGVDRSKFGVKGVEITIEAIKKLIEKNPSQFERGLTIPILSSLSEPQIKEIKSLLSHDYSGRFKWVDLQSSHLNQSFRRDTKGTVHLVYVGNVPQSIFFQFFRLGNLPAIISGKGTKYLMEYLGKPYISAIPLKQEMAPSKVKSEKSHTELAKLHQVSEVVGKVLMRQSTKIKRMAAFIEEAMHPSSSLREYMDAEGHKNRHLSQDKVFQSLVKLLPLLPEITVQNKQGKPTLPCKKLKESRPQ